MLIKDRISEGGERLCDLGFIVDPRHYGEFCQRAGLRDRPRTPEPGTDAEARFHSAFEFIRDLQRHRLTSGKYVLEIVADALRIHPESFWLELEIPTAVPIPQDEDERRRGLPGFQVQFHQHDRPGFPSFQRHV
jgi:hypothetical protein